MRTLREKPTIDDPRVSPLQVILTDAFQLGYVLERLLSFTGPAKITASTFGNGEEFLRKLMMLRGKGLVAEATLYCDTKAAEKNAKMHALLKSAYDSINFCDNHSKVLVVEGTFPVVLLASQNQTRGNRLENYVIVQNVRTAAYCIDVLKHRKTAQLWKK